MLAVVIDIETGANDLARQYSTEVFEPKPDGRLSDQKKIDADKLKKRTARYEKSALYWWTGQIVVIGYCPIQMPLGFKLDRKICDVNQFWGYSKTHTDQIGKLDDYAWGLHLECKSMKGSEVPQMVEEIKTGHADHWDRLVKYCQGDVDITADIIRRMCQTPTGKPQIGEIEAFFGLDEASIIKDFFAYIESLKEEHTEVRLIGKQSKTFDLPYLAGRAAAHDIPIPDEVRVYQ